MSKIILFHHSDNLYTHFKTIFSSANGATVITPSPLVADATRKKLADETVFNVVTISKFLQGELDELVEDDLSEKFKGKSELILILSTLWKKLGQDQDFDLFMRCFNLLTDFRSFSLSNDILETVLENYDPSISLGVLRMHQVMQQLDIYDEHRSYFELSDIYRQGDLPIERVEKRNIIFLGFDFLSGSQVDLLNSLGIRDEVFIPFYKSAYDKKSDLDWISWLKFDDEEVVVDECSGNKLKAKFSEYAKNYLPALIKKQDPDAQCDLLLGTKRANLEQLLEANVHGSLFKLGVDIFEEDLEVLIAQVYEQKQVLLESIDQLIEQELVEENYKRVKVLHVFKETYRNWTETSEINTQLRNFDIKILKEVMALDLPRVSIINSQKEKFKNEIFSLSNIENINESKPLIIALASDYGSIKSNVAKYNKDVEKYLASIGPIRRSQFEFEILKEKLQSIGCKNICILAEFGFLEKDYYWKEVLDGFELEKIESPDFTESSKEYLSVTIMPSRFGKYSATMLQTYYDCPRKYYFNYIEKLSPKFEFKLEVDLLSKGQLEHLLIEKYVSSYNSFSIKEFNALQKEILDESLKEKQIELINMKELEVELNALCVPIIEKLLIIKAQAGTSIQFESALTAKEVRGSIDCIIETDNSIYILDFKRGAGSIPTQTDFLSYEKIQLWFYAHYFKTDKPINLGYINLSESEKSLLYMNDEEDKMLSELLGVRSLKFKDGFELKLSHYIEHEGRIIANLMSDKLFLPKPRTSNTCNYCHFKSTCSKGVLL